jgi:hypothetical protein
MTTATASQFQNLVGKKIHLPESTKRSTVAQIKDFGIYGGKQYIQVIFTTNKKAVYTPSSLTLEQQFAK